MKHKQNWNGNIGAVTLKSHGRQIKFDNINEFFKKHNYSFITSMYDYAFYNWSEYHDRWEHRHYWGMNIETIMVLVDQHGLVIPKSVVLRMFCEAVPKERPWLRWTMRTYNHERDFRKRTKYRKKRIAA